MYKTETYGLTVVKSLTNLLLGTVFFFSTEKRTASILNFCLRGKKTGSYVAMFSLAGSLLTQNDLFTRQREYARIFPRLRRLEEITKRNGMGKCS